MLQWCLCEYRLYSWEKMQWNMGIKMVHMEGPLYMCLFIGIRMLIWCIPNFNLKYPISTRYNWVSDYLWTFLFCTGFLAVNKMLGNTWIVYTNESCCSWINLAVLIHQSLNRFLFLDNLLTSINCKRSYANCTCELINSS